MSKQAKKSAKAERKEKGKRGGREVVHIGFLIDESGSMITNREAVVAGYNEFVSSLREDAARKDVRATLAFFDSAIDEPAVRVRFRGEQLAELPALELGDYNPRGGTPLNDAVLEAIELIAGRAKQGERAMLVIMTDGYENASRASSQEVRRAIEAREQEGWSFIYLGADHDSWAQSSAIGLGNAAASFAVTGSAQGYRSSMASAAKAASLYARVGKERYEESMTRLSHSLGGALPADRIVDPAAFADGGGGGGSSGEGEGR